MNRSPYLKGWGAVLFLVGMCGAPAHSASGGDETIRFAACSPLAQFCLTEQEKASIAALFSSATGLPPSQTQGIQLIETGNRFQEGEDPDDSFAIRRIPGGIKIRLFLNEIDGRAASPRERARLVLAQIRK